MSTHTHHWKFKLLKGELKFWGIPTQQLGGWGAMPLLLALSPSTSVYSNTLTLHQVSLISDRSSLSFTSFDISEVSQNDLPTGNRWNLSHRQNTYTSSNPVNISLNGSDILIGLSRLITTCFFWVPVLWILFCNYANRPMINPSALVSENVVPPCDVPHSLFTPDTLYISAASPCVSAQHH